jgi:hypothetical protein
VPILRRVERRAEDVEEEGDGLRRVALVPALRAHARNHREELDAHGAVRPRAGEGLVVGGTDEHGGQRV